VVRTLIGSDQIARAIPAKGRCLSSSGNNSNRTAFPSEFASDVLKRPTIRDGPTAEHKLLEWPRDLVVLPFGLGVTPTIRQSCQELLDHFILHSISPLPFLVLAHGGLCG
jgi:hypothetical protein